MRVAAISFCALLALACPWAAATTVNVLVEGTVDFNVIGGSMSGVPSGSPVTMSFDVDSADFVDSPNFPTRGYPVDLSSFEMLVDGRPVDVIIPQPFGTAFFVLRNNDPAVDGVFLSTNIDFPFPIGVTIPGLAPDHELDYLWSFADDTPFPSLDILDAVGSYDLSNIGSFDWSIGRFGSDGAFYIPDLMTISVVPEPAGLAWLALLGLPLVARLRRR